MRPSPRQSLNTAVDESLASAVFRPASPRSVRGTLYKTTPFPRLTFRYSYHFPNYFRFRIAISLFLFLVHAFGVPSNRTSPPADPMCRDHCSLQTQPPFQFSSLRATFYLLLTPRHFETKTDIMSSHRTGMRVPAFPSGLLCTSKASNSTGTRLPPSLPPGCHSY